MQSTFKYTILYAFAAFCLVLVVLLVGVNAKVRADSQRLLRESIESQLLAICHAARENLDPGAVAAYSLDPAQLDDPAYAATLDRLRSLAAHVGAKFIYVLKYFDGRCHFVMDTDPEATAGDMYDAYEPSAVHVAAFQGRDGAGVMNVDDEYGSFHTGAIPVMQDGRVVAVVSADIEDRQIRKEIAANRANMLLLAGTLALVMVGMGAVLFRLMRKVKTMQDRLTKMAHYDTVTGLPNRQYLIERLEALEAKGDRSPYALFFTDLDNFKTVNDKAGHDAGDALLKHIGAFLGNAAAHIGYADSRVFRPSAGRINVTARIGGDEFVLVIPGVDNPADAARIAKTLIDKFHEHVTDEHVARYRVGLSIGAALYPSQSDDYHVILKYADIAMYHAKRAGKNDYRVYEHEMPEKREK